MLSINKWITTFCGLVNMAGICGWLLIARPIIYLVFSRRRDLNAYATVDASAFVFIIYAILCFVFSLRQLNSRDADFGRSLIYRSPLFWFVIYTALGGVSILWSVNVQLTGFRAFECFSMLTLIVAIIQKLFEQEDFDIIIRWTLLYVTIDVVFSLIRALSYTTDISMLLQTSQMMSTVFFFVALYDMRKRWYHYLIMAMAIFSMSTTAYIGMSLGGISLFWGKAKYRIHVLIGAVILACIITIVGPYKFIKDTVFFEKQTISLHETSGRDKIMKVAVDALSQKPEGYGFFAGEPYLLYAKRLGAINGHNSLFSAAIGLGIPGVVLISLFFLGMYRIVFSRYIHTEYKAMLIGCFMVAFLHCMGNPGLGSRVFGSWLPVMFLCALVCGFYVHGKYYSQDSDIMNR